MKNKFTALLVVTGKHPELPKILGSLDQKQVEVILATSYNSAMEILSDDGGLITAVFVERDESLGQALQDFLDDLERMRVFTSLIYSDEEGYEAASSKGEEYFSVSSWKVLDTDIFSVMSLISILVSRTKDESISSLWKIVDLLMDTMKDVTKSTALMLASILFFNSDEDCGVETSLAGNLVAVGSIDTEPFPGAGCMAGPCFRGPRG